MQVITRTELFKCGWSTSNSAASVAGKLHAAVYSLTLFYDEVVLMYSTSTCWLLSVLDKPG